MEWKTTPFGILIFTCVFYFLFAVTLIHPVNLAVREHGRSTYGKQDRHILRVWRLAKINAVRPFAEVKNHALFHGRNPGLFKFIAELTQRAGAKSPIPLQIFLIFLVILGIIAQHLWLKEYFKSDVFPIVGNLFILGTHYLTFFGSTIHQHPYNFAFFNFCMLCIVRFVNSNKKSYFLAAWACYFILCQSYYMFWVSTFIMMTGVLYFSGRKLINKLNVILGLAPILTVLLLMIQVSHFHGGFKKGFSKVEEAAKARMLDEIKTNKPHFKKKMSGADWLNYPMTISSRVERYFYIPGIVFVFLFWLLFKRIRRKESELNYKFFYFLIPAGLSWYFLMFQHTSVHVVAGRYSYFLWMIFLGFFFHELKEKLKDESLKFWLKYTWIFILAYGIYGFGYVNLKTLTGNFYRLYQYHSLYSEAESGNVDAQIKLFANKFLNSYDHLDESWMENLEVENFKLNSDLTYEFSKFIDGKLYILLKSKRYYIGGNYKLFVNNKFIDLIYPNEYVHYWGEDKYTVIALSNVEQLNNISIKRNEHK
jgi:hypothetical protein